MPALALSERRAFVLRKLHSLSGVLPLGVFLVEHLWTNSSAIGGRVPFDDAVDHIQRIPFLPFVEVVGIFLPLAFHAVFGVYLALSARPNVLRYPYGRNWLYFMQRGTGLVALAFLVYHLWEFRIQKWLFGLGASAFYDRLEAHLSATTFGLPWLALGYVVGLGATVFHFANGLWGFCASWGVLQTRPAQRRGAWVFGTLGVGLFLLGVQTVVHFATGAALFEPSNPPKATLLGGPPCPAGTENPIKAPQTK